MEKWEFPSANHTGTYGLKSHQETFKDNPMLSLAKEICQNSLDAVNDTTKPVIVEFHYFTVPHSKMPDYDNFVDVLENCEYFNKVTYKNNTSRQFYLDALDVIEQDNIPILRISDFNTRGLTGSDNEDNSDWTNLVKAIGVSDKGDGKGGSFGQGKFATFACSSLQTVFYSTNSIDGDHVSQGVARLSSFYNDEDDKTLGLGYFGNKNCSKMDKCFNIDPDFYRESSNFGTDIFIMGFIDYIEDWENKILASVIDTFYVAILDKKLIFKLNNIEINYENINDYLAKENIRSFLDENTIHNFESYFSDKRIIFKGTVINDGDLDLYFLPNSDNECQNRVAIFRKNGMKIFDQNKNPKSPTYGATLRINNIKTDAYFRTLENPQHNGWSKSRAKNEADAENKIRIIRKFIRDSINQYVSDNRPDSIDVEGLGEYLPDDFSINDNDGNSENLYADKAKKLEVKKRSVVSKKNINNKNEEDKKILMEVLSEDDTPSDTILEIDDNQNNSNSHSKLRKKEEFVSVKNVSNVMYFNNGYYNLHFELEEIHSTVKIDVLISGETIDSDDLIISEAKYLSKSFFAKKHLTFKDNSIIIEKNNNKSLDIQFKIQSDEQWPLEVKYYAIKK